MADPRRLRELSYLLSNREKVKLRRQFERGKSVRKRPVTARAVGREDDMLMRARASRSQFEKKSCQL